MEISDLLCAQSNSFDKPIEILFNIFYKSIVVKSMKQKVTSI